MKCLINSVKNSSSKKKKKKNPYRPTLFLFSPLRQYNNFLFLALLLTVSLHGVSRVYLLAFVSPYGFTSVFVRSIYTLLSLNINGSQLAKMKEIDSLHVPIITFLW